MTKNIAFLFRFMLACLLYSIVTAMCYFAILHERGTLYVFYAGLLGLAAGALVSAMIAAAFSQVAAKHDRFKMFFAFEITLPAILLAFFALYAFHITFPTIIDRSISLHALGAMRAHPQGLTADEMVGVFYDGYASGPDATCRRLTEQLESGDIVMGPHGYQLTPKAGALLSLLDFLAAIGRIDPYYLQGSVGGHPAFHYAITNHACQPIPAAHPPR